MSGLVPRKEWFRQRVRDCIAEIAALDSMANWNEYMGKSLEIAAELTWAATEWEKCYPGDENDRKKAHARAD